MIALNNGHKMPMLGLGVYKAKEGQEVKSAIQWALETGYRHIDTAAFYQNEEGVGAAIRESGFPQEEIFVTTKVWNADQGYDATLKAFDRSEKKLGLNKFDLYLVHWPVKGKFLETWKACERLYKDGRVKAIGVSNFMINHLEELLAVCEIRPTVNQIEYHPYLQQPDLIEFCHTEQIVPTAWSPLMQGKILQVTELAEIGQKYGKSIVQVTLRWILQKGITVIPKSVNQNRIQANFDLFDFELSPTDMALIDGLDKNQRVGPDPNNFNF